MTHVPAIAYLATADEFGNVIVEPIPDTADYIGNAQYVYGERLSSLFATDVEVEGTTTADCVHFSLPTSVDFRCAVDCVTVVGVESGRVRLSLSILALEQQEAIAELFSISNV